MQGAAGPTPHAQRLLADTEQAVTDLRRAHARVLSAVAALERDGIATETGHPSTSRLLQDHLRLDPHEASTWLRHSSLLMPEPGPSTGLTAGADGPTLPATAAALTEGAIGLRHLAVVAEVMHQVTHLPHLHPDVITETERQLAGLARLRSPAQLARDATEILLHLDPDGQLPDEPAHPDRALHLSTGRDGSLTGRFRFHDPDAAETLRTALDALTPPPDPTGPARALPERRADALHDMAADALGLPHDHPDTDTGAATDTGTSTSADSTAPAGGLTLLDTPPSAPAQMPSPTPAPAPAPTATSTPGTSTPGTSTPGTTPQQTSKRPPGPRRASPGRLRGAGGPAPRAETRCS